MKRRPAFDLVPALVPLLALLLGRPATAQDEPQPRFPRAIRGGGPPAEAPPPPVTEILVKLRDAGDAADVAARGAVSGSRRPGLAAVMAQFDLREGRRLLGSIRHRNLDRLFKFRSARLQRDPQLLRSALEALRKRPEVEYAEPNALARATWTPGDPYYASSGAWGQAFPDLWGLQRIGAESAWDRTRAGGVVVAVLDTGIDADHPDLAGQLWEIAGETGTDGAGRDRRTNGLDDDGNGFVDDWRGFDFAAYDADPADDNGHGTHVAGTIGATANNGVGVAGVAPEARLMAVKVLDRSGYGWVDRIASGIDYAARNGAKVINLSLGGTGETPRTLVDVIDYAHDVLGVVVVAAAGNEGSDIGTAGEGTWPANIRDVIAVGATDHDDHKASFSNFGAKLDLVAPGGGDTDPSGAVDDPSRSVLSLLSSTASASLTGSGSFVVGGQYLRLSGTSMATPHVAGAAALVRSLRPALSPEQVRQALRVGASDLAPEGFDPQSGYGRLHADAALLVAEPLAVQITTETQTLGLGSPSSIQGTAAGPGLGSWTLEYGAGSAPSSWTAIAGGTTPVLQGELADFDVTAVPDGAYTLRLRAEKASGESFEDRLAVSVDNVALTSPASKAETPALYRGGETVEVFGSATPAGFVGFTLTVRGKRTGLLSNPKVTLAGGGGAPILNGLLGTWDTTGVAADHYDVCVRVTTATGLVEECSKVLVDPWLHPGWPRDVGASYYSLQDHLTAEDIDGDGKKDLLVAYAGAVSVLDHAGNLLPGWPQSVGGASDGALTGPVTGDLDGDGAPEVVAASSAGDVFVWRADGTLLPGWPMRVVDRFPTLALGDVDGDGVNEIVVSDWGPTGGAATLAVVGVDGAPRPGWPVSFPGGALGPVSLGDVDGDGSTELVVVTQKPTMEAHVFRSDGSPLAGWPRQVYAGSFGYLSRSTPALGDLDRDGALDIVLVTPDGKVHAYDGDGTPLPGWPVQTDDLVYTNPPALGDLDGDGSLDVVVGGRTSYRLNYLYAWSRFGAALAGWPHVHIPAGYSAWYFGYGAATLADVDGDGLADVVASADVELPQAFALEARRYDGSPAFGFPRPTLDLGASATNTAAVADLDGDGKLEMAWLDYDRRLWVWDLPVAASAEAPWPMFRHDPGHTGAVPSRHRRLTVVVSSGNGASGTVTSSPYGIACTLDAGTAARTCPAAFAKGAAVTLSASSPVWSRFEGWGGACSGTGICTVTLSANASVTASFEVTNQAPVAALGGPYSGTKGQAIAFDGSASQDPEGAPLTYAWTFGDGTTGTGARPSHAYTQVGTFTVTLTVGDGVRTSARATTTAVVVDAVPPAPISTLRVTASTNRTLALAWTATGDDGTVGTAAAYDLRYSTQPLTTGTFATAFPVQDEPAPKPSGSAESLVVASLLPGTTYSLALVAIDAAGNASPLSNVVSVTTAPGVVVYRDDFEAGLGGWAVSGTDGKGGPALWHLSPHRVSSPTQAAYYGIEAKKSYDTSVRNYGALTSGEISLRGAQKPFLSFQHALLKQMSSTSDLSRLFLSTDGGATWGILYDFFSQVPRMSPVQLDLSPYNRSVVRLRFEFDTVNANANDYEGWVVDDVMITADGVGPLAAPGGPYSGYKRQPILFDGSPSLDPEDDPLTFAWDFGDGKTGEGVKPSHAYEKAGTFTVKLTVSDGVKVSPVATTTATVQNRAPVAGPGGPYAGMKGEPIALSGAGSSDPDGDPLTYAWSFGDGTSGTGVSPTHAYAKGGTFTVSLTVSDGSASSTAATTTVVVTDLVPPSPVSTLAASAATNRSVTLAWTATGDDGTTGTAARYDLRYSTLPLTEETFAAAFAVQEEPAPKAAGSAESLAVASLLPGTTYHFALKVLDAVGNASPLSNVVSVTTAPGVVVYRDDFESGLGGWTVSGADGKGGPGLWHLSPHRVSSPTQAAYYGIEAKKSYDSGARNYGAITSAEIDLRGAHKPVLSFQHFAQKETGTTYDLARVQASTNGGATWTTLLSQNLQVLRLSPVEIDLSAYNRGSLRLRFDFDTVDSAANSYEGWVVDDVMVTADGFGPVAAAGGPYSGYKRQPIAFDGSASFDRDGDPLAFAWDFGDGTTGDGPRPSHAYTTAGTFTVKLVVTDGVGTSPAATTTVTVQNRLPVARPGGPYAGLKGEAIAFSGADSSDPDGDPLTWSWAFGDGTYGTGPTPTHAYAKVGTFTVYLTVHDGTASSSQAWTTAKVTDATPPSPVSNLAATATTNRSVTLAWTATGDDGGAGTAASYDLRYSTEPLTEESFATAFAVQDEPAPRTSGSAESLTVGSLLPGTTYHFALKATDAAGNVSPLSNVAPVTTAPGVVVFRDDFEGGLGGWTVAGANGAGGGSLWHLSPHRVNSPTQAAYYGVEGSRTYNTGYRNHGTLTSGAIDLRGAARPVLSLQHFLQKQASASLDTARLLVSTDGGGTWATLAGIPSAVPRMSRLEADLSAYNRSVVRLRFEFDTVDASANDYEGWVVDDVMITADGLGPVAAPGGPYSGWKRQPVAFDGSQSLDPQGDPLAFAWDFGDGTTGEGPTPTHAYETAGTFTVTLTVSDGAQVSPAATTTVSVPNRAPLAHPGGPYAGTRGEAIAFSGAASSDPDGDPITFLWIFGDGTAGSGPSPTHAYAKGGTFTVSLIVNDGAVPSTEATTTATVTDSTPPSPVSNLAAPATTNRSVTLAWTATGDDGVTGSAARYDVRYSAVPPTEATFAAAFQVPNEAPPRPAGTSESLTVGSLLPGTTYHFALRVLDAAGNASALSNVVSVTTAPGVVVFRDDFEAGLGGWTASGTDGKGGSALWHASPHRVSSPTQAAYYGIEATKTYDTGARNYGSITSGPIDLRGLSGPVLSFQHFLQKELASSYDVARVLVQTAEGGAWTTLATLASQDTRIMSPFEIDLSAYAQGSVRLRFDLDTMDAWGNGYEGWVVDDVMVTARAAGTPP